MSLTYLVEAHCGGYYLSQDDPDDIERICETCGDCDRIVAEFDDEDPDDAAREILDYFADDVVPDEYDLLQSCQSVEEMRIAIDAAFSDERIDSILHELAIDSDDPLAAAMFRLDPRKAYGELLDKILDECGVAHDGKDGDERKQEKTVMHIARTFSDRMKPLEALHRIIAYRFHMSGDRDMKEGSVSSDLLDDISRAYETSLLHDGMVAAVQDYL